MSKYVPQGWSVSQLDKPLEILSGFPFKSEKFSDDRSKIGLIRIRDLSKQSVETFYDDDYADEYVIRRGDILIGMDGDFNIVKWNSREALLNQRICKINARKGSGFDTNFLFYSLVPELDSIHKATGATTVKHLSVKDIRLIEKAFPPLPEQQKIASILTAVDDVIESTQAQINKLKDLKTGMMQELLTKGIGHTEFKDSPVGRIPKAWEVKQLGQLAKLERGRFSQRPRNDPAFYGGAIPFLQTGDIPKESPYISEFTQTLNEKGLNVSKLFKKGTLVITIAATIGEIGLLKFDSCFPDSLVGITVDEAVADRSFLLYSMKSRKDDLESLAPQTAQKNINLEILNPFLLAVPSLKEQQLIGKSMEAIDQKIEVATQKYTHFSSIIKALMQDLLTGKVRVKIDPQ